MARFGWLIAVIWIGLSAAASAQSTATPDAETCPMIVQTAITLTNERCDGTDVNQVCYGHLVLDSQPRPGLLNFEFDEPGDIVDVIEVQSLRLSAMDTLTGRWGVVTMQIEAKLAQTPLEDAELQILLFGDAELNDATRFLPGHALQATNVRQQPTTDSPVVIALEPNTEITANGRLADDSWIRIHLPQATGWVRTDLLDLQGDQDTLKILEPQAIGGDVDDELANFGPMQAFLFNSGVNDAPCAEAPNSGLLIQTPEGVASVTVWLDEVVIQLDATAFIQAAPDGSLIINVLEGSAEVEAMNDTRTVIEGMQINIPLNNNSLAADVPGDPQPYPQTTLQSLPLELLRRPIIAAIPRSEPANIPIAGDWRFSWDVETLTCPDGTTIPFESTGEASFIQADSESLDWNATQYRQSSPGIYRASYVDGSGNLHQDTLQVVAPDRILGEKILDLANPVCTLDVGFRLQLVTPADE